MAVVRRSRSTFLQMPNHVKWETYRNVNETLWPNYWHFHFYFSVYVRPHTIAKKTELCNIHSPAKINKNLFNNQPVSLATERSPPNQPFQSCHVLIAPSHTVSRHLDRGTHLFPSPLQDGLPVSAGQQNRHTTLHQLQTALQTAPRGQADQGVRHQQPHLPLLVSHDEGLVRHRAGDRGGASRQVPLTALLGRSRSVDDRNR